MSKLVKETELFGGNRRKAELDAFHVLRSKAGEKRLKLAMRMPLSGESLVAMPDWIGTTYEAMHKDDSAMRRTVLDRMLKA